VQQGVVIEDEGLEVHQASHLRREALQLVVAQVKVEQVREVDEKLIGDGLNSAGTRGPSEWPWMCAGSNPERGTQSEVGSGGGRGQGELCCQEPHLLWPRLSTSMFLAFSSSRGHSVRSLRLKSWGMKAGIILSPGMGPPYHNYHPLPPQGPRGIFGTTLQMLFSPTCVLEGQKGAGPEAQAEALAGGRGSTETQHLPAPRGPPAGRCHRGLLSSSGCLHVPRLPSKWTERNDCSHHVAPAPAEPLRRTRATLVWSRDAWGQHPRCMGCSMGHSPGGRAGWTAHRGAW